MEPKSGTKTSEFKTLIALALTAVIGGVLSILVLKGVISSEEADIVKSVSVAVIPVIAVGVLGVMGWGVVRYGQTRAGVKEAYAYQAGQIPYPDEVEGPAPLGYAEDPNNPVVENFKPF